LRTFVAVVEQGSVSKASLQLRVAQPALSRQISDLEAELGIKLFDRIRRRLVLSSDGERLLSECRTILTAVGSMRERVQLLRRADTGVLKVVAPPPLIDGVLSNFLRRYARRRPQVQVKITEAIGNVPAVLERGEVHLSIGALEQVQAGGLPFESLLFPPQEFWAACNPSLKLSDAESMDIRSLGSHPLLLPDTCLTLLRSIVDAAFRLADFRPNILFESRNLHTLLALAEVGYGVAIVNSIMPTQRYRLRIVRLTYRGKSLRLRWGIHWDKRRALPAYAEDFCQSLAAYMREVFPISRPDVPKARSVL
jgi:LysR family transcriptional regulator, nitrogen assimilation regulatory protein